MILTTLMLSFTESPQLLFNLFIGLIVYLTVTYLVPVIKRIRSLPPGPWGLPFVGYLPFIGKTDQYKDIDRLAKKYGPILSVRLGQYDVIVISDWKHLKEAFSNDDLLDRPTDTFSDSPKAPSILEMSGDLWKAHRRLLLHTLRDVGRDGKSDLEVKVKEEIENFLPTLSQGPVDLYPRLLSTISNNISNLLMDHALDYEDPISKKMTEILITLGDTSSLFHIFNGSHPKLVNPSEQSLEIPSVLKSLTTFASYMENEIELHKKKSRSYSDAFDDYIGGHLVEQRKRGESRDNDSVQFNLDTLRQNLVSLYGAGTETVAVTLSWAIICLIEYPEYHDQIQSEIEKVIGYERQPEYTDRLQMPLTMAFIYEVHRFASIVPINLIRRASKDTTIGTYNVPKDSLIMFNLYAIHRDPLLWIGPEQFDPKRFLAEHGTKAIKPPFLVPFSGGERSCPGEGLANVQLFLYLVNIVQKYKIRLTPGTEISFERHYGTVSRPKVIPELIFEQFDPQKD